MALCVQKEDMRLLVVPQSSIEQYRRQGEDKALPSELKVRLTPAWDMAASARRFRGDNSGY
jgi:hypothetical protein